jgi:hypothetical protein
LTAFCETAECQNLEAFEKGSTTNNSGCEGKKLIPELICLAATFFSMLCSSAMLPNLAQTDRSWLAYLELLDEGVDVGEEISCAERGRVLIHRDPRSEECLQRTNHQRNLDSSTLTTEANS